MSALDSEPKLHHAGYVVADIEAGMAGFCRSLNGTWDGRIFEDPLQRVKVAFLTVRPGDAQIELVEPVGENSPVRQFLERTGGGLHHLCYEVCSLEKSLAQWKQRGAIIAKRPKPAVAFEGRLIAWVFTAEKLLVELLEEDVRL